LTDHPGTLSVHYTETQLKDSMRAIARTLMIIILLVWALFALLAWGTVRAQNMPWPAGAVNPGVTASNIASTICKSGWTDTIRPSTSITNRIKAHMMQAYALPGSMGEYELDHIISLQLGGHPYDRNNLVMQPYAGACGARVKDNLETHLKHLVCSGAVPLVQAQMEIRTDWVASYNAHLGPLTCTP
jgi:hypothetical protein